MPVIPDYRILRTSTGGTYGKMEHVFAAPFRAKNGDLGVGWPDITTVALGSSGLTITVLDFAKSDVYTEQFHLVHGVDLTAGSIDVDLHHCMSTAESGKDVKVKVSVWLLAANTGTSLSSLSATPDGTYTWTINPPNTALALQSAYITNAIDLTALSGKEVHSHLGVRLERLSTGDTHGGQLYVLRGELIIPMGRGTMIAGT